MPTRRDLLARAGAAAGVALAGCSGGGGGGDAATPTQAGGLDLTTPAFDDGGTIPTRFTCDGANVSPALRISGVPAEAATLALVVDDPDAPREEPFVHWLLWNVPSGTGELPEDVPQGETVDALDGARQGTNSAGNVGYSGPCPPTDDGAHTYRFVLRALDVELDVAAGAERGALESAAEGRVVGATTLTGEYDRN